MSRQAKCIVIFLLVFSWLFAGWPRIWENPPVPPKIQETKAEPAVPVIETWTEQGSSTASQTLTLSKPSGVQTGDFLLLIVGNEDASNGAEFTDNLDGWNYIGTSGDSSADADIGAFWRTADGTESDTVQVTATSSDQWMGFYVRISGTDDADPINTQYFSQSSSSSNSHVVSGVDTAIENTLAIVALMFDGGDGYPFTVSGTGWSKVDDYQTGASGWNAVSGVFGSKNVASGNTGDAIAQATGTVSDGAAYFQLAIAPAAGAVVSVSVSDGVASYGITPANTSKSTLPADLNDIQTATNDGNVTEDFNIRGQDASGGGCAWTLASTNGSDQYVHQFCNDTDLDCSLPPTNYTALTTSYQALDAGIAVSGTVDFQLRLTTPNPSSCYGQQSVDVIIQAVQQ